MGGATKGLNDMKNKAGFKVGDKVGYLMPTVGGLKSLKGLTGTIRYVNDIGAEVVFKTNKGEKIYTLVNNAHQIKQKAPSNSHKAYEQNLVNSPSWLYLLIRQLSQ